MYSYRILRHFVKILSTSRFCKSQKIEYSKTFLLISKIYQLFGSPFVCYFQSKILCLIAACILYVFYFRQCTLIAYLARSTANHFIILPSRSKVFFPLLFFIGKNRIAQFAPMLCMPSYFLQFISAPLVGEHVEAFSDKKVWPFGGSIVCRAMFICSLNSALLSLWTKISL